MQTELVPVFAGQISGVPAHLVDARRLHSFLESAQQFADWIKNRIADYGFVQDQDFLVSEIYETKKGRGGNRKAIIEYSLTIDTAKEIAMVERNEKGREVRRYFIECERRLRDIKPQNALKDLRSRKALPGGLTLEQQDAIKALVKGRAEQLPEAARAGATITLWSAIKSKFGVSYKAIPTAQFGEALSLVARVPLKAEPDTLASMILFHGGQQPLQGQRFLVTFADVGHGYTAQPVAPDCCVATPAQFAQRLATPGGLYLDNATLLELIVASAQRLQIRAPAPH